MCIRKGMKVVLVEWAAYPVERNKLVGGQLVRCGLGRSLEAMQRWPAGLPLELSSSSIALKLLRRRPVPVGS